MHREKTAVIAMDGPAGAGKSTVARRVAQTLGFTLLDTGALYRSIALAARRAGVDWAEPDAVSRLAHDVVARRGLVIEPAGAEEPSGMRVRLDGDDVAEAIRTPEISMGASKVSAIPGVRAALLDLQRDFVRAGSARGVVAEGRDIGTVVFPEADVKLFVTASVDERAGRRHRELQAKGSTVSFEATRAEVAQRDAQDEGRAIAPLRKADDAVLIDTTGLDIEKVVAKIADVVVAAVPSLVPTVAPSSVGARR
jgi:cytidylate kinase